MVSAQIGKLIISKDLDKTIEERLDMLHQYFLNAKARGSLQVSFIFHKFSNSEAVKEAFNFCIVSGWQGAFE